MVLDQFIKNCFFRLMALVADDRGEGMRRDVSHIKMACKTDSKKNSLVSNSGVNSDKILEISGIEKRS